MCAPSTTCSLASHMCCSSVLRCKPVDVLAPIMGRYSGNQQRDSNRWRWSFIFILLSAWSSWDLPLLSGFYIHSGGSDKAKQYQWMVGHAEVYSGSKNCPNVCLFCKDIHLLLMLGQNDAIKIIYVSDAEFETGNLSSSDTENLFLE